MNGRGSEVEVEVEGCERRKSGGEEARAEETESEWKREEGK